MKKFWKIFDEIAIILIIAAGFLAFGYFSSQPKSSVDDPFDWLLTWGQAL